MSAMPEPIGRVKACTECRQQKVRCDAYQDYSKPCSRCRTSNLPCVISKNFQRREKQTKAQLQHELDRLRHGQYGENVVESSDSSPSTANYASPTSTYSQGGQQGSQKRQRLSNDLSTAAQVPALTPPISIQGLITDPTDPTASLPSSIEVASIYGAQSQAAQGLPSSDQPTLERTLGTVVVDGEALDTCYAMFLKHYAPHLAGLFDKYIAPNERYEHSTLLFWTMVCVGARGHTSDPGLYNKLGEPVLELAFKSLYSPAQALPVVQAVLILCNWPMPFELVYRDPSQALGGAAMGLAIQNGLHMYCREQDFNVRGLEPTEKPFYASSGAASRVKDEATVLRTRIWAYCLVIFQSTSLCDGLPPTSVVPCFRRSEVYGEVAAFLPEMMSYRMRLHKIQIEASNTISGSSAIEGSQPDSVLNSMITSYDERIRDVVMPHKNQMYHLVLLSARISTLGLYFVSQQEPDHIQMANLYSVAIDLLRSAKHLDAEIEGFTFNMPSYYVRMCLFAAHLILRVYKSPLALKLDLRDAKPTFFTGVEMMRRRTMKRNDILGITAIMLSELWPSTKAFTWDGKRQNGLKVQIRHRLALNPVFDAFWWWRKEFGRQVSAVEMKAKPTQRTNIRSPQPLSTSSSNVSHTGPADSATAAEAEAEQGVLPDPAQFDDIFKEFMDWWDYSSFSGMEPFVDDIGAVPYAPEHDMPDLAIRR